VNAQCPIADEITIINVCVTSAPESGKFIHNEYRYNVGTFTSPLQSNLVTFATGSSSPIVSQFSSLTGAPGTGGFPPAGATMRIASNKIGFDTFVFNLATDKFRFLRTNTLYTPSNVLSLIAASTNVTASGSGNYYSGTFTVPSSGQYLYLIWDYRDSQQISLCYSNLNDQDACCGCNPPT
jgi:hypothetical protein